VERRTRLSHRSDEYLAERKARNKREKSTTDTYIDPTGDLGGTDPENWWAEQVLKTYVSPDMSKSKRSVIPGVTPAKDIPQLATGLWLGDVERTGGKNPYAIPGPITVDKGGDDLPFWDKGWKTVKQLFGNEPKEPYTGGPIDGYDPNSKTDELMTIGGGGVLPPWLLVILAAIAPYAIDTGMGLVKENLGDWTEVIVSKMFSGDTKWAVYSRNKLITVFSDASALDDYLDSLAQDLKKTVRVRRMGG